MTPWGTRQKPASIPPSANPHNHAALVVAGVNVTVGRDDLVEGIGAANNGLELAVFRQRGQHPQIVSGTRGGPAKDPAPARDRDPGDRQQIRQKSKEAL